MKDIAAEAVAGLQEVLEGLSSSASEQATVATFQRSIAAAKLQVELLVGGGPQTKADLMLSVEALLGELIGIASVGMAMGSALSQQIHVWEKNYAEVNEMWREKYTELERLHTITQLNLSRTGRRLWGALSALEATDKEMSGEAAYDALVEQQRIRGLEVRDQAYKEVMEQHGKEFADDSLWLDQGPVIDFPDGL